MRKIHVQGTTATECTRKKEEQIELVYNEAPGRSKIGGGGNGKE